MTTEQKKTSPRWGKGSTRYDKKQLDEIEKKYHEPSGWHRGAKVRRK